MRSNEIHAVWSATGGLAGSDTTEVDMTGWTPEQIAEWTEQNVDATPDDIQADELIWFSINGQGYEKRNGRWEKDGR